jgi:hypothetical protein
MPEIKWLFVDNYLPVVPESFAKVAVWVHGLRYRRCSISAEQCERAVAQAKHPVISTPHLSQEFVGRWRILAGPAIDEKMDSFTVGYIESKGKVVTET